MIKTLNCFLAIFKEKRYLPGSIAFFISVFFWWAITPVKFLGNAPPSGGDLGSHFATFSVLVDQGFRAWNPGNLFGEFQLINYFPGSFLVMKAFHWFLPMGWSFNLGLMVPLILFPFSSYLLFRGLGFCILSSFIAEIFSLGFLYNENFTIWGGNAVSLIAGQFAHLYAFVMANFFIALLGWEIRNNHRNYLSSILLSLIPVFHTYVFLAMPFILLGAGILYSNRYSNRLILWKYLFKIGLLSLILSLWFLYPLVDFRKWTYPIRMILEFANPPTEILPPYLQYLIISVIVIVPFLTFKAGKKEILLKDFFATNLFFLIPAVGSAGLFFIFPYLNLVNVRALPLALLFLTFLCAHIWSLFLKSFFKKTRHFLTFIFLTFCFLSFFNLVSKYPPWIQWTFSGWDHKPLSNQINDIKAQLQGNFSEPRTINEHHPELNQSGSTRVFELLPLWIQRSSIESLYAEATHTSYIAHDLQARISEFPSCFIRDLECPKLNFDNLVAKLKLAGIENIILYSGKSKSLFNQVSEFKIKQSTKDFSIYGLNEKVHLIQNFNSSIKTISQTDWKIEFGKWFKTYTEKSEFLVVKDSVANFPEKFKIETAAKDCQITEDIGYNRISFTTDCPDQWHLLKFSYSPFWQSVTKEPIYLISPGFMLLQAKSNKITLEIKFPYSWTLASLVSLMTLVFLVILTLKNKRN